MKDKTLQNKTAVITGVSKGIGRAMGEKFIKEAVNVVGFSRTRPSSGCLHWVEGDVTNSADRKRLLDETLSRYGSVDILVNNAGLGLYDTWINSNESDIRKIFEINFFSMTELTRLFIPELKKKSGLIINTSSIAGKISVPCMGGYSASKFAVNAFSDSLRIELKPHGIRVLNLIVGRINTGFSVNSLGSLKPPHTPGAGSAEKLAEKVFLAMIKNKKEITYPSWYVFLLCFIRLFPGFYEYMNLKKWRLSDKT